MIGFFLTINFCQICLQKTEFIRNSLVINLWSWTFLFNFGSKFFTLIKNLKLIYLWIYKIFNFCPEWASIIPLTYVETDAILTYISGYPVDAQVDGSDLLEAIPISVGVPFGVLQINGPPRSLPQIPINLFLMVCYFLGILLLDRECP